VVRRRTTPTLGQIGARIRAERLASGLSQEAAAANASIGYKHWQEIEGGRANPTVRTLIRIAAALDTDLCALLCTPSGSAKLTSVAKQPASAGRNRGARRRSSSRSTRSA
jgi:transcriptional regulator with XRE-family HTH domain